MSKSDKDVKNGESPEHSENGSIKNTLKLLRNFIETQEKKNCDNGDHDERCGCVCGECIEASSERCDAPILEQNTNAIYTKLPKYINFAFPTPKLGTLAEIIANDRDRDLDTVSGAWKPNVESSLSSLISDLKQNGLSANAFERLYRNPALSDKLGDVLYESILANSSAALSHGQSGNINQVSVEDTIETLLNLFGSGLHSVHSLNYFVKLPHDTKHELKAEFPLKWVTSSLISKITHKLSSSGTAVYIAVGNSHGHGHHAQEGIEINVDPLKNASTGVVNIRVKLHVDPQGNVVKNYADTKLVQNASGRVGHERGSDCDPTGDIVYDYNFYFVVDQGKLVNGLVFFRHDKRDYAVLSILPYKHSALGLRSDKFYFAIPTIGTGQIVADKYSQYSLSVYPPGSQTAVTVPLQEIFDDALVNSVSYEPVFTPAILLSFVHSCGGDECESGYILVNETNFNL